MALLQRSDGSRQFAWTFAAYESYPLDKWTLAPMKPLSATQYTATGPYGVTVTMTPDAGDKMYDTNVASPNTNEHLHFTCPPLSVGK